ncbi:MAG: 2-oxoacid:acceptor oxidoreductase family protein [Bacillota bacterium]
MAENNGTTRIALAGIAGQGIIMVGRILATAALDTDLWVRTYDVLGTGHRGTLCFVHISISNDPEVPPLIAAGEADLLVGFEPLEAMRVGAYYLKTGGEAILNTKKVVPVYASIGADFLVDYPRPKGYPPLEEIFDYFRSIDAKIVSFNATDLAESTGHYVMMNMILMGAIMATGKMPLSVEKVKEAIEILAPKGTAAQNILAFEKGMEAYKKG